MKALQRIGATMEIPAHIYPVISAHYLCKSNNCYKDGIWYLNLGGTTRYADVAGRTKSKSMHAARRNPIYFDGNCAIWAQKAELQILLETDFSFLTGNTFTVLSPRLNEATASARNRIFASRGINGDINTKVVKSMMMCIHTHPKARRVPDGANQR